MLRSLVWFVTAIAVGATCLTAAEPEPAWKQEFREAYGLSKNQMIRRVPPPYPDCRSDFLRDRFTEPYRRAKLAVPPELGAKTYEEYFTKFVWKDDWFDGNATMHTLPVQPEAGVQLASLLQMVTGYSATRTDGGVGLAEKVTGDFIVRADARVEQVLPPLEKILRQDCKLHVKLRIEEQERNVYVLSGTYRAQPLEERQEHQLEIYATALGDRNTGGGGSGSLQELAAAVEGFVLYPVLIENVVDAPRKVEWHYNYSSPFTKEQWAADHDPEAVTDNVAAQTGLAVKLDTRKLRILVVEDDGDAGTDK